MSVPTDDGRILRVLAESIGAKHIVELGTSVGYSGLWFSIALKATAES
jgi:predicted O-methyltransferase YrrM